MRAWIALAVLLMGLALTGGAAMRSHYVGQGVTQERDRWHAAERLREQQAAEIYAENVRLGSKAAAAAIARARTERTYADQLSKERRHAVLTVPAVACAAGPDAAGAEPVAALLGRTSNRGGDARSAPPDPLGGLRLTADAVRLWNSALAGTDVPAGACGADGAPTGACAADDGVSLDEAWDNQAYNALSCRLDRARYRELIDLLRAREAQQSHKD